MKLQYLRNKIINGCFEYWQRGASFISPANTSYQADRWAFGKNGSWNATVSRSTDVPIGAFGVYSNLFTVTTAQPVLAGTDEAGIQQRIEGNILRTFKGRKVVMTFWAKSSVAGPYHVSFVNGAANRSLVKPYTISQAGIWEKQIIRFTHDESGAWDYSNGIGLFVWFSLAEGPTRTGPVDIWQNGLYFAGEGQTNLVATVGNTFQLTDVCLVEDNEDQTRVPYFELATNNLFEERDLVERYHSRHQFQYRGTAFGGVDSWLIYLLDI